MLHGRSWLIVVLMLAFAGATACGERHEADDDSDGIAGPSAPLASPTPTPTPSATPTPGAAPTPTPTPAATAVAYVPDVKPIIDSDCVRCHSQAGSLAGVLRWVRPGDANSVLVVVTRSNGSMYGYLSGDRPAKADLIRRWVVDNGAAQSR